MEGNRVFAVLGREKRGKPVRIISVYRSLVVSVVSRLFSSSCTVSLLRPKIAITVITLCERPPCCDPCRIEGRQIGTGDRRDCYVSPRRTGEKWRTSTAAARSAAIPSAFEVPVCCTCGWIRGVKKHDRAVFVMLRPSGRQHS